MDSFVFEMRLLDSLQADTSASLFGAPLRAPILAAAICESRILKRLTPWDPPYLEQIAAGLAETVLVVGTEVFSRLLDWSDRSTCILCGDGAGAVVLRRDDDRHGLRGFELGADGSGALLLSVAAAGHAADHDEGPFVRMNGPEVYKFATRVVVDSSLRSLEAAGLGVEDVDVFVPHQANRRIIDHAARRLGLDEAKVFSNVDRYGNTSAGSIPLCLDEAWRQGRIGPGDIVLMVGFGGGLAWGSCVMEWTKERA